MQMTRDPRRIGPLAAAILITLAWMICLAHGATAGDDPTAHDSRGGRPWRTVSLIVLAGLCLAASFGARGASPRD